MSRRKISTEATTAASAPPASVSEAMSANSMMPTPPGVSGMAVSSRANANAASTCAQPTSASDTPMTRRVTSSTA